MLLASRGGDFVSLSPLDSDIQPGALVRLSEFCAKRKFCAHNLQILSTFSSHFST